MCVVACSLLLFVIGVRLFIYVLLVGRCCRCFVIGCSLVVGCCWVFVVFLFVYRVLLLLLGGGRLWLSAVCRFVYVGVVRCAWFVACCVLLCVCDCSIYAVRGGCCSWFVVCVVVVVCTLCVVGRCLLLLFVACCLFSGLLVIRCSLLVGCFSFFAC